MDTSPQSAEEHLEVHNMDPNPNPNPNPKTYVHRFCKSWSQDYKYVCVHVPLTMETYARGAVVMRTLLMGIFAMQSATLTSVK